MASGTKDKLFGLLGVRGFGRHLCNLDPKKNSPSGESCQWNIQKFGVKVSPENTLRLASWGLELDAVFPVRSRKAKAGELMLQGWEPPDFWLNRNIMLSGGN